MSNIICRESANCKGDCIHAIPHTIEACSTDMNTLKDPKVEDCHLCNTCTNGTPDDYCIAPSSCIYCVDEYGLMHLLKIQNCERQLKQKK